MPSPTLIHVTHEAVHHIGGIGTVLQGLLTSKVYRQHVGRSILVGPLPYPHNTVRNPLERLGEHATDCFYSGPDHHDPVGLGALLKPIEWAFGTRIVFGRKRFFAPGDEAVHADADLLLIDVSNPNRDRLASFKWFLFEKHLIESQRYESNWDFEEYTRLADPAYHALCALLGHAEGRALLVAHEFMGLPTALRCTDDRRRFRTLFHAHECSTARRLAEGLPGGDIAFYRAMNHALKQGQSVGEVFGDQSDFARHALVSRAHVLDGVMAVGPETADELRFLSPQMRDEDANIRVIYNGLPAPRLTANDTSRSRALVNQYLHAILGYTPDYLITHVTRPVPSKGLWRDLKLCRHLAPHLAAAKKTAVYLLLTSGGPTRTADQANEMHHRYRWPVQHHDHFPDLTGPETQLFQHMEAFNKDERPVKAVLVNQFGFSQKTLGDAAPKELTTADLRRAADVELGMSTYEPFGIAQLEPLHAGAICVTSTVCGCMGLVRRAMHELGLDDAPNIIPADFISGLPMNVDPLTLTAQQRDAIEETVCTRLAGELFARLPKGDADRAKLLALGQKLAEHMSWDFVAEHDFLPMVKAVLALP
jgi:hypothetical protein